ncbi:hypothetical protein [Methylotenera mobilis]|uniref:hypothetical protein n=1 Tax=Methylotenera mobilis TaxID=359408 RepID=UPI000364283E|nr:hypothetical protein [Methylotenera mobilis]
MSKTKITLLTLGHMPPEFDKKKILKFRSSIFEIIGEIESYSLTKNSDGNSWEFYDSTFESEVPKVFNSDFLICIVNVPLQLNWYSRRLSGNRVVFTFYEIKEYLKKENIPIENVLLRMLNSYTLLYKRSNNTIPKTTDHTNYTHDETRGCLFDMNGVKHDIIVSCNSPIICPDCIQRMKVERVSEEVISRCRKDIRKIRKTLFYRITDFIKIYPIFSLSISSGFAITLSIFASYIYDLMK